MRLLTRLSPFATLAALATLSACGSSGPQTCAASDTCRSLSVGPSGGEVSSSDNAAQVTLPAGALAASTNIDVATLALSASFVLPAGANALGALAQVKAGATLQAPLTVTLTFDPSKLGTLCTTHATLAAATDVQILTSPTGAAGTWTALASQNVDGTHVSAQSPSAQYFVAVILTYAIDPTRLGYTKGKSVPDVAVQGPAILDTSNPATIDSSDPATWVAQFSFEWLHDQSCKGYRYAYLDLSAGWCVSCGDTAADLASSKAEGWLDKGGLVVSLLEEGPTANSGGHAPPSGPPATTTDLTNWIQKYQVDYSMVLDQQQSFEIAADVLIWPTTFFIRLSDMQILATEVGESGNSVEDAFEGILAQCDLAAGTGCPSAMTCSDAGLCHSGA